MQVNVISLVLIWSIPTVLYGAIPAAGLGVYVYKCWQSMCNLGAMDMRYLTFLMLFSVTVFLATYAINGRIFYIAHQHHASQIMMDLQFQDSTGDKLRFVAKFRVARSVLTSYLTSQTERRKKEEERNKGHDEAVKGQFVNSNDIISTFWRLTQQSSGCLQPVISQLSCGSDLVTRIRSFTSLFLSKELSTQTSCHILRRM